MMEGRGRGKDPLGIELQIDTKEKLVIKPSIIAFAVFASTLALYSPNMNIFTNLLQGTNIMGSFVFPMLLSCFAAALLTVLYAANHSTWKIFSMQFLGIATVVYLFGILLFFVLMQLDFALQPLAAVAGICVGSSLVPISVAWGAELSLSLKNALFCGSLICLLASLMSWGLTFLPTVALQVVFPIMVCIGAATPFVKAWRKQDEEQHDKIKVVKAAGSKDMRADPLDEGDEHPKGFITSARDLLSIIWLPFAGLLLYALLTSVHKMVLFEIMDSEYLSGALAAFCIICLCFIRTEKPLLPFVYKVIVPIAIAALIVLGSFPVGSIPQFMGLVGLYIFFIFLALFALASLMAVTHAEEFTPTFIYGFALMSGTAVSLIGLFQAQILAITENFSPIIWVAACIYFAIIIISLSSTAWKSFSTTDDMEPSGQASLQANLSSRCEAVSERCGLSPRETEILGYLSRGYNPTYIAKTLIISVSTARSHVRNIYRKIGVGSRDELLQLIDNERVDV